MHSARAPPACAIRGGGSLTSCSLRGLSQALASGAVPVSFFPRDLALL